MGYVHRRSVSEGSNVVAIGGGTGLATLLSGLKEYVGSARGGRTIDSLSAIVAVTDDGGSSGRLREELQMPPPGDIRNCMVALSEDATLLATLFQHRFSSAGSLRGHSFGNLFLAALSEITGDFAEAVRLSSEILASKGHIFPASLSDVRVAARLKDGTVTKGETSVSKVGARIDRLFLEPEDCEPHPEAILAIGEADLITVGPGSLFTSLLPPLLVKGVADAVTAARAKKVFICNLMTQPGETEGFTARRHLEIVREYLPDLHFDAVVVNSTPVTPEQAEKYLQEGAEQIGVHGSLSITEIDGTAVLHRDILASGDLVRHDPAKLADIVMNSFEPAANN
jgi:uncharacterized cofD-like protein